MELGTAHRLHILQAGNGHEFGTILVAQRRLLERGRTRKKGRKECEPVIIENGILRQPRPSTNTMSELQISVKDKARNVRLRCDLGTGSCCACWTRPRPEEN